MEPVVTAHTQELWPRKALGATGLMVPPLCLGTSELSGRTSIVPNPPGEQEALATVRAILDGPIPSLDTAAGYGESERHDVICEMVEADVGVAQRMGCVLTLALDEPTTGSLDERDMNVRYAAS